MEISFDANSLKPSPSTIAYGLQNILCNLEMQSNKLIVKLVSEQDDQYNVPKVVIWLGKMQIDCVLIPTLNRTQTINSDLNPYQFAFYHKPSLSTK